MCLCEKKCVTGGCDVGCVPINWILWKKIFKNHTKIMKNALGPSSTKDTLARMCMLMLHIPQGSGFNWGDFRTQGNKKWMDTWSVAVCRAGYRTTILYEQQWPPKSVCSNIRDENQLLSRLSSFKLSWLVLMTNSLRDEFIDFLERQPYKPSNTTLADHLIKVFIF